MKKGTIIALVITIIYCGLSTYVLFNFSLDSASAWNHEFFVPGYIIGLFGAMRLGSYIYLWIGQIITFLIIFYILKALLNSIFLEFQKQKK